MRTEKRGNILIKEMNVYHEASEMLDLQLKSYQFEAELIGTSNIPPLRDTVESIQQSGETFLGYYMEEEICGVISHKAENNEMDIHRLFVHPAHFRKGIAKRLLTFIEKSTEAMVVKVATATKNTPAIHFYQKNGFRKLCEEKVEENLSITHFIKEVEKRSFVKE